MTASGATVIAEWANGLAWFDGLIKGPAKTL
jgi:hypothetical protein